MPSANATTGYVVVFINEWWYTQYLVKVPSTWKTLHWGTVLGSLLTKTPVSEDCFYLLHTCLWYCLKCVSDSACRHYQQGEGGSRHLLSKYCKYPCTLMSKLENTICDPINRIITLVPHWGLIHAIMEIIANNAPCFGGTRGTPAPAPYGGPACLH